MFFSFVLKSIVSVILLATATLSAVQDFADQESPIALANLEGEPSALVHGCVNVITGQFCESHTDLIFHHGADNVTLSRSYLGSMDSMGTLGSGWAINHISLAQDRKDYVKDKRIASFVIKQDNGSHLRFINRNHTKHTPKQNLIVEAAALEQGVTNMSGGYISGQTNLKNWRLNELASGHKRDKYGKKFSITYGDGCSKTYENMGDDDDSMYRIQTINLPSGNKIAYTYSIVDKVCYMTGVSLVSKNNTTHKALAFPVITSEMRSKGKDALKFSTHDGRWVKYGFSKLPQGILALTEVNSSDSPPLYYGYRHFGPDQTYLLTSKQFPDGRALCADYYTYRSNEIMSRNIVLDQRNDPRMCRVKTLKAPCGNNGQILPLYKFIYDLNVTYQKDKPPIIFGGCDVYDALNHRVQYGFTDENRLLYIDKFNVDCSKASREYLYWGKKGGYDYTNLVARILEKGDGTIVFSHAYTYDKWGNILEDRIYGNLSGNCTIAPQMHGWGQPIENGCECHSKHYTYSEDGLNLLLREDDGSEIMVYKYAPGTNRLIAKYQGDKQRWYKRWFYTYSGEAVITQEIVDDGHTENVNDLNGVSHRFITYYTSLNTCPVGMPSMIERKCLDLSTGKEVLIEKVVNTYNMRAKLTKQVHYDSQDKPQYTLEWAYDSRGNLIEFNDALGFVTYRQYDANNNCVKEQGPNPDFYKTMSYDLMNRLIEEKEIHQDGNHRSTSYKYDLAGRRIASVDENGNATLYKFDAFGRVIEAVYPEVINVEGVAYRPSIQKEYDVMGNVICETDAKGVQTHKTYTIRGQIAKQSFSDGTTEIKTYYLNGLLKDCKAQNGTLTYFYYDSVGRPIRTETHSADGKLCKVTSATYNGFNVLTETDANGLSTLYTYYPDGKMKSKRSGSKLQTYEYDPLGRLVKLCDYYGEGKADFVAEVKKYDLLDRVLEECLESSSGETLIKNCFEYDVSGQICKTTRFHSGLAAISTAIYDSHGNCVLTTDAENNATTINQNYSYRNKLGQLVFCETTTDPLGNQSLIIKDALNRVVESIKHDRTGQETQRQETAYDENGNVASIVDYVYFEDKSPEKLITRMEYDQLNRLTACIEATGTADEKVTKITYNALGQKYEYIQNNGVILVNTYDGLGRLASLGSSDGTIHYTYEYDGNDRPIMVEDRVSGTKTLRSYDEEGRLVQETLANGLSMKYAYDRKGRPIEIILPDHTSITHKYKNCFHSAVQRYDAQYTLLYEHLYEKYDESGLLLTAQLSGKAGELSITYDRLGRQTSIETKPWQEKDIKYDQAGNLIEKCICDGQEKQISYTYDDLYQLASEVGDVAHNYKYDSQYNRREKDGYKHELNALNQLLDDEESAYVYDANGNLIEKQSLQSFTYTYDALNRLVSLNNNVIKAVYTYDDTHRRLSKTLFQKDSHGDDYTQVSHSKYLFQGNDEIGMVDEDGKLCELRVLGKGKGSECGAAVAIEIQDKQYVPVHDISGSVTALLDMHTGEQIESYHYSAFGEELFERALIPWRYASKRVDPESGFIFFGRRYYAPEIGRWITPDPIGREGGANFYGFVLNNPLAHIDYYGLFGLSLNFPFSGFSSDFIPDTFEKVVSLPGRAAATVVHNFVPIPYVKDVLEFGCLCFAGKAHEFVPSWQNKSEMLVLHGVKGELADDKRLATTNGIMMESREEFIHRMSELSNAYGGVTVYGAYNASHGLLLDIMEVFAQKLGIPTHAQQVIEGGSQYLLNEMGWRGHIEMHAHSQGCTSVDGLSSAVRSCTVAYGYGPATVFHNSRFKEAENYLCVCDPITPMADPLGLIQGVVDKNVHFLKPKGNPLSVHGFDNSTYFSIVSQIGSNYKKLKS